MARRSVVIDLEIRNKQARAALEGVEGGFTRLSQKTQQSTTAMTQGFNRASQSVRGNIQPVQNLTRIVEDAPFGVRGVANNINPFIESFSRMGNESTTTAQKMKMLLTSAFTGPGAILTISALVTSAITAIQMGLFDWGEEAESTDEQMESLMETMDEFIDEQRQLGGENIFDPLGQASTEQRLDQVRELKNELESMFELRDQAEDLRQTISETSRMAFTRSGSLIEENVDQMEDQRQNLVEVNEQLDRQEELFEELSEAQRQDVLEKIKDIEATANLNDAFLRLNPALQRQLSLNQALRPVLRDVELGLSGAQDELEELREGWEEEAEQLRENIEAGKFHGDELTEKKNILQALLESINQVEKAEEGLTDQQKSATEAAKQLKRARRELVEQMQVDDELMGPTDIDVGLEEEIARDTRFGSIGDLRADLKELNEELDKVQIGSNRFHELNQEIAEVEKQLQRATGSIQQAGDAGNQAMQGTVRSTDMLVSGLVQAKIRGEELEETLKRLATQMVPRALMGIFTSLIGGGGLGFIKEGVAEFSTGIFDTSTIGTAEFGSDLLGFAHGSDMGFPGIGRVGERGEELLIAPPMSSIITNENVERMDQWRSEARQGAANISNMSGNQIEGAVMNAIAKWNIDSESRVEGRDFVTMIRKELKQQGGKGGNGSI